MRMPMILLACTVLVATEDLGALLEKARAARDAGRYEASLAAYDAVLAQVPDHETALFERAQTLGWAGRHPEALEAFRLFKARYPGRALEADLRTAQILAWGGTYAQAVRMLEPWARQGQREAVLDEATYQAWSGRLPEALSTLDAWLREHPDDLRAALDKARFHSWSGDLDKARHDYQAILERTPGDPQAQLGLARLALWNGAPEAARDEWGHLGAEARTLPEAQVLEAQIEAALGRPANARTRLEPLAKGGPEARDARDLLLDLADAEGPWIETNGSRTNTSEGLRTQEGGFRARLPFLQGHVDLGLGRYGTEIRNQEEHSSVLRAGLSQPLGPRLRLRAALERHSDLGGRAATGHAIGLACRAAAGLDLRLDWARTPFTYTPAAMLRRGAIATVDAGAAWTFGQGLNLAELGAGHGSVSAGSSRETLFVSYQRRFPTVIGEFRAGALFRRFGYSQSLPLGFFNPEDYRWWGLTGGYTWRMGRRLSLGLDARSGRQAVDHGRPNATWSYGANLAWNPEGSPWAVFGSWNDTHAGLPVADPTDPSQYWEHTLSLGVRVRLAKGW